MAKVIFLFLMLVVARSGLRAESSKISDAPRSIQELADSIQGQELATVRTAIIARFGPASREVGSGLRIEEWDVSGGVLTFHPLSGPIFTDTKTRTRFRLLRTHNPAGANILNGYEMKSLADEANHGMYYWLGNVKFGPNATYHFVDSKQFPHQRAAQKGSFFMLHPTGTVEVRYRAPVTTDTLLESVAEGATIAQLIFSSADDHRQATFSIRCSEQDRRLTFDADQPLSFRLDTTWSSFWK